MELTTHFSCWDQFPLEMRKIRCQVFVEESNGNNEDTKKPQNRPVLTRQTDY